MPIRDYAGLKLACRHGHWGWQEFALCALPSGAYAMACACDLGNHYLAPDPADPARLVRVVTGTPYPWPAATAAVAARARFERQERGDAAANE